MQYYTDGKEMNGKCFFFQKIRVLCLQLSKLEAKIVENTKVVTF